MKTKEEIIYSGSYKELFEGYILYKQSLGFQLEYREKRQLFNLNKFLNQYNTETVIITETMANEYIHTVKHLSSSTIHAYAGRIRQLALYARNIGHKDIYVVPEHHTKVSTDFIPYIFSKNEIDKIFKVTNEIEIRPCCPTTKIFYQTIIRLLYSTGMRISEALSLTIEDVILENNILIIYDGKGNVSRIIPYDDSLGFWLKKYNEETYIDNKKYFFESPRGGKYNRCSVKNYFEREILSVAGIPRRPDNRGPRLHDLRHTFACHSLDKMIRNGMDQFCALPYLSTYLGHKGIESTEKYLRLTEDRFGEIIDSGHYIYQEGLGDVHE